MRNSTKFADLVAGILNEQLAATQMRLPHGNRQPAFPAAVKIAGPAIFIAISMLGGMSFHKTCSYMPGPEFAMHRRPVGLR